MAEISIVIPSLKQEDELKDQVKSIRQTAINDCQILTICKKQSAAKNRNECIERSIFDLIIMLDDDIGNFFPGWDELLIQPFRSNPIKYSIVAARLIDKEGNRSPQLGDCDRWNKSFDYVRAVHTLKTGLNVVGSSCISFYKDDLRFDELYLGATYEDADFCMQMNKQCPEKEIIINNQCKLIHNNEGKGRSIGSNNYSIHNKKYFAKKWGIEV